MNPWEKQNSKEDIKDVNKYLLRENDWRSGDSFSRTEKAGFYVPIEASQ